MSTFFSHKDFCKYERHLGFTSFGNLKNLKEEKAKALFGCLDVEANAKFIKKDVEEKFLEICREKGKEKLWISNRWDCVSGGSSLQTVLRGCFASNKAKCLIPVRTYKHCFFLVVNRDFKKGENAVRV